MRIPPRTFRYTCGCVLPMLASFPSTMLRDGRPFTSKEWWVLWDILMTLKDEYGEGPGHVDDELLTEYKQRTRGRMKRQGLKKHGTGGFGGGKGEPWGRGWAGWEGAGGKGEPWGRRPQRGKVGRLKDFVVTIACALLCWFGLVHVCCFEVETAWKICNSLCSVFCATVLLHVVCCHRRLWHLLHAVR